MLHLALLCFTSQGTQSFFKPAQREIVFESLSTRRHCVPFKMSEHDPFDEESHAENEDEAIEEGSGNDDESVQGEKKFQNDILFHRNKYNFNFQLTIKSGKDQRLRAICLTMSLN